MCLVVGNCGWRGQTYPGGRCRIYHPMAKANSMQQSSHSCYPGGIALFLLCFSLTWKEWNIIVTDIWSSSFMSMSMKLEPLGSRRHFGSFAVPNPLQRTLTKRFCFRTGTAPEAAITQAISVRPINTERAPCEINIHLSEDHTDQAATRTGDWSVQNASCHSREAACLSHRRLHTLTSCFQASQEPLGVQNFPLLGAKTWCGQVYTEARY